MDMMPDIGPPDWGVSDATTDDIAKVRFGDGYELRSPNGINFRRSEWPLRWSHLDPEVGAQVYDWLEERKGLTAFLWRHPTRNTMFKVVCEELQLTHDQFGNCILSVKLSQDFNP